MHLGKCNRRHTACNPQHPDNMRHAAGNMQRTGNGQRKYATHIEQRATRNAQHALDFVQHAANNHDMQRNMQRATCMQQTTANVATTACNGHQATREHVVCSMRETPRKRRQAAGNACNRQRATDSRLHARGREHMRDATRNTRHCRISCAASSGQPAACARHCTRQPVRNTAQTPHTRCNIRPVTQHATNSHEKYTG